MNIPNIKGIANAEMKKVNPAPTITKIVQKNAFTAFIVLDRREE